MKQTANQDIVLRIEEKADSFLTLAQINESGRLHNLGGSL
jgi:hypothetical protein